jgi:hypothetical protein
MKFFFLSNFLTFGSKDVSVINSVVPERSSYGVQTLGSTVCYALYRPRGLTIMGEIKNA